MICRTKIAFEIHLMRPFFRDLVVHPYVGPRWMSNLLGLEIVQEATEKIHLIKEKLKNAQDRLKKICK